jgi:hypothetical protein
VSGLVRVSGIDASVVVAVTAGDGADAQTSSGMSLPAPPGIVSLPAPPGIVSLPAPPVIVSARAVPVIVWLPAPPLIVLSGADVGAVDGVVGGTPGTGVLICVTPGTTHGAA